MTGLPQELFETEPLQRPGSMVVEHAELAVVAAILADPEAYFDVADVLEAEDFADNNLREIYAAATRCERRGTPIDALTVADELQRTKSLGKVGGIVYLNDLVQMAGGYSLTAARDLVSDRSLARKVVRAGRTMTQQATDLKGTGQKALEVAESEVFAIGHRRAASSLMPLADAIPETMAELAHVRESVLLGHTTGLRDLDLLTGGVQRGQLITVAARPAMGKSAFALSLARAVAENTSDTVVFLSYEMSRHELTLRLLASAMAVELGDLRRGQFPPEMTGDLVKVAKNLERLPIFIDDSPPETVAGVRAAMRRLARRETLGCVVIDYLQLMAGEGRGRDENRVQEVSSISRGLKRMARELDVPVVTLSQLNRQLESRPNKRPMLSDLRESGSIEQDSDTVWMLYRPWVYNPSEDPETAEIIVAKQRQGVTGTVHARFEGPYTRFVDREEGWTAPAGSGGVFF